MFFDLNIEIHILTEFVNLGLIESSFRLRSPLQCLHKFAAAGVDLYRLTETLYFQGYKLDLTLHVSIKILNQSLVDQGLLAKSGILELENVNVITYAVLILILLAN